VNTIDSVCKSMAKALWLHAAPPGREFGMYPWCAKCRQPVQELSMDDFFNQDARAYAVRCHGQVEVVTVTREQMMTMEPDSIKFGWAFEQPEQRD
jgi:hypothetical protein